MGAKSSKVSLDEPIAVALRGQVATQGDPTVRRALLDLIAFVDGGSSKATSQYGIVQLSSGVAVTSGNTRLMAILVAVLTAAGVEHGVQPGRIVIGLPSCAPDYGG